MHARKTNRVSGRLLQKLDLYLQTWQERGRTDDKTELNESRAWLASAPLGVGRFALTPRPGQNLAGRRNKAWQRPEKKELIFSKSN